jgi:hypothetical protein
MAAFTTQVELLQGTAEHYRRLDIAMTRFRFVRTIKAGDSSLYALLPGHYDRVAHATIDIVLENAKAAARTVGVPFRVLVTEAVRRLWFNLDAAD